MAYLVLALCLNIYIVSSFADPQCTCVPYYQCMGGFVNLYGSPDTIDERFGNDDEPLSKCKDSSEVCCKLMLPQGSDQDRTTDSVSNHHEETNHEDNKHFQGSDQVTHTTDSISNHHEVTNYEDGKHFIAVTTKLENDYEVTNNGNDKHIISVPIKPGGTAGCGIRRVKNHLPLANRIEERPSYNDEAYTTFFGEFPWMVGLYQVIAGKGLYLCGGSLISPSTILTGAHCVNKLNQSSVVIVRAGDWNPKSDIEPLPHLDRYVTTVTIHEEFNKFNLINDIALVGVDKPFDWSITVDRVCVEDEEFKPINCFALGWGENNHDKQEQIQIMKKVELSLVDRSTCQEKLRTTRLGRYFQLHPSFICAGGIKNQDTCKVGDGGGPLICSGFRGNELKYAQLGIVSWGVGCNRPIPAIYTNVRYFYKWINDRVFL